MNKSNILQTDRPLYSLTISEYIELNRQILFEAKELSQSTNSDNQDEILTIEQASKLINLAKPTIYGLTCKNLIPFIKKAKKLYFRRTTLLQWLDEGRIKTDDEIKKEIALTGNVKIGRK